MFNVERSNERILQTIIGGKIIFKHTLLNYDMFNGIFFKTPGS